jgi:putative RNA 2'-phosphotransferase
MGGPTDDHVRTSKFLSYVLRHRPDAVGIALADDGWVDIETLLAALARHGRPTSRATLDRIVAGTDKQRLEVDGERIRAAQGHTVEVDLGLAPVVPPPVLYHGTVEPFLAPIRVEGLTPRGRTHVHLSADRHTANAVGARRGRPVILTVDAAGMHGAGHDFYRAANGVWLTAAVPPQWIARDPGPSAG